MSLLEDNSYKVKQVVLKTVLVIIYVRTLYSQLSDPYFFLCYFLNVIILLNIEIFEAHLRYN